MAHADMRANDCAARKDVARADIHAVLQVGCLTDADGSKIPCNGANGTSANIGHKPPPMGCTCTTALRCPKTGSRTPCAA
jgi:hypothetical protein